MYILHIWKEKMERQPCWAPFIEMLIKGVSLPSFLLFVTNYLLEGNWKETLLSLQ